MAGRNQKSYPIYIRELEILEAYPVTESMYRLVLGGDQLGSFVSNGFPVEAFRTENADDHVKIVIPDPTGATPPPVQLDGTLDWPAAALARARDYTPRRFDAQSGRLELDFVGHVGGLAAEWATSARVGDRLLVAGPRGTTVLPDDIDWYFLVGDETALPAIARRIEEVPAGTPVTAIVSIPTAADEQAFDHRADLDITWIHRDREDPDALLRAVQSADWRSGQVYAWAAGEASTLRPIRRWLRDDRQVDRGHLDIAGYWRAGQDQYEMGKTQILLRERADLAFPYAVRAVVSLGIAELVADGVTDLEALADRNGVAVRGLTKIIRLLSHEELFTLSSSGRVGLTKSGAFLIEDFAHKQLDHNSGQARLDDGWPALLDTLRTGTSGYQQVTGRSFWQTLAEDRRLGESFDSTVAESTGSWADEVVEQLKITDGSVIDIGGGTGTLLSRILTHAPAAQGILVELPTTAGRARESFTSDGLIDRVRIAEQSFFSDLPAGGDHYLLAQVLRNWPDAECVVILQGAAAAAGDAPIHVIERLPTPDDHDHDLIADLQLYATFGGGERTEAEFVALAEQAGLEPVGSTPLPEELQLLTFTRH